MENASHNRLHIGITGARGFIGRRITETARAAGWQVTGFSRDGSAGTGDMPWRRFELDQALDVSGLDAIVHLAGENILGRWNAEKKRRIRDSRILGTRAVVKGIERAPTDTKPTLICASAIGFYGDTGDAETGEDASCGKGFLAEITRDWEDAALRAEAFGARVVLLRIGMVLGRGGGAVRLLRPVFRMGLGGPLGNGRQWMSCIHVDDVAGMALFAARDKQLRGPLNAVMPSPTTNREFTRAAAAAAHRPALFPAPAFAIRLALGELSDVLLCSQRVVPQRARRAGYVWRFPTLPEALRDVFR